MFPPTVVESKWLRSPVIHWTFQLNKIMIRYVIISHPLSCHLQVVDRSFCQQKLIDPTHWTLIGSKPCNFFPEKRSIDQIYPFNKFIKCYFWSFQNITQSPPLGHGLLFNLGFALLKPCSTRRASTCHISKLGANLAKPDETNTYMSTYISLKIKFCKGS